MQTFIDAKKGYNLNLSDQKGRTVHQYYDNNIKYRIIYESNIIIQLMESLKTWVYEGKFTNDTTNPTLDEVNPNVGFALVQTCRDLSYNQACALSMLELSILELAPLFDVTNETHKLTLTESTSFTSNPTTTMSVSQHMSNVSVKMIETSQASQKMLIADSIELLWNIVELTCHHCSTKQFTTCKKRKLNEKKEFLNLLQKYLTSDFVSMLSQNVAYYLCHGYSIHHKQTRNCILVMFVCLAKNNKFLDIFENSQLIDVILQYLSNDTSLYDFQPFSMV